jgi:hypothetical protein
VNSNRQSVDEEEEEEEEEGREEEERMEGEEEVFRARDGRILPLEREKEGKKYLRLVESSLLLM